MFYARGSNGGGGDCGCGGGGGGGGLGGMENGVPRDVTILGCMKSLVQLICAASTCSQIMVTI